MLLSKCDSWDEMETCWPSTVCLQSTVQTIVQSNLSRQRHISVCVCVSNVLIDIQQQKSPCTSTNENCSYISWSQSLPCVCDNPPSLRCCCRGHLVNCFHKGSRGMSRVLDFLASPVVLGDPLLCGGGGGGGLGWKEGAWARLRWEYRSAHTMWPQARSSGSSGNDTRSLVRERVQAPLGVQQRNLIKYSTYM